MADNNPDEELVITMLGAGQEVGRSCHLIEFKGKKILLVRVHYESISLQFCLLEIIVSL